MLASCPDLPKGPERVCILPEITQPLGRLALQRLDALWCPPQGSIALPFKGIVGAGEHLGSKGLLELKTQLACVHTHLASACESPPPATLEVLQAPYQGCSSCNKKKECLETWKPPRGSSPNATHSSYPSLQMEAGSCRAGHFLSCAEPPFIFQAQEPIEPKKAQTAS